MELLRRRRQWFLPPFSLTLMVHLGSRDEVKMSGRQEDLFFKFDFPFGFSIGYWRTDEAERTSRKKNTFFPAKEFPWREFPVPRTTKFYILSISSNLRAHNVAEKLNESY